MHMLSNFVPNKFVPKHTHAQNSPQKLANFARPFSQTKKVSRSNGFGMTDWWMMNLTHSNSIPWSIEWINLLAHHQPTSTTFFRVGKPVCTSLMHTFCSFPQLVGSKYHFAIFWPSFHKFWNRSNYHARPFSLLITRNCFTTRPGKRKVLAEGKKGN